MWSFETTGIHTQKKTLYASQAHTERVQLLREMYRQQIRDIRAEDLIFIDETGINLMLLRLYARAYKGQRAVAERPPRKGKNVTLVGAMGLRGMIASLTFEGGLTGDLFEYFVEHILVPSLWVGACVVMDNLSSHVGERIQELIEAAGARLVYLPPYSPDFNPIENCWSKIKEFLRSVGARSKEALDEALTEILSLISLKDIEHWFTYRCYCT